MNNKDKYKSIDASSATMKKISNRPLNNYNLFFILELELLLLQNNETNSPSPSSSSSSTTASSYPGPVSFNDYIDLVHNFPPLPSKYQSIDLPVDWFMHGKDKKQRRHIRSHGIIMFSDLAALIASRWKAIKQGEEKETLEYVMTVAAMIKRHRDELRVAKEEHRSHLPDAGVEVLSTAFPQVQFFITTLRRMLVLLLLTSAGIAKKTPRLHKQEWSSHQCSYHSMDQTSIQHIRHVVSDHPIPRTIK